MSAKALVCFQLIALGYAASAHQVCWNSITNTVENYDPSTQLCCNGVHNRLKDSKRQECCIRSGGRAELYFFREKICCGEQLTDQFSKTNPPGCCNKEMFDKTKYGCCGSEDFGEIYQPNIAGKQALCCMEEKQYTLQYLTQTDYDDTECCGNNTYKKYGKEQCRFENKVYKLVKTTKCDQTEYDPDTHVCCDTGTVLEKPHIISDQFSRNPNWACFNDRLYDKNNYYIHKEASKLIPVGQNLCGNDIYSSDDTSKYCCDGVLKTAVMGVSVECCGKNLRALDNSTQCCNKMIVPFTYGCCGDRPFSKGGDIDCCAGTVYNKTESICCTFQSSHQEIKRKEAANHTDCCGERTYNKNDRKVCIDGKVVPKRSTARPEISATPVPSGSSIQQSIVNGNEVEKSQTPKSGSKKIRHSKTTCSFCQVLDIQNCRKKHYYQISVYKFDRKETGSALYGVITSPTHSVYHGVFIRIRTSGYCRCFKGKKEFALFTNRQLIVRNQKSSGKQNLVRIRISENDVLIKTDDFLHQECEREQYLYRRH